MSATWEDLQQDLDRLARNRSKTTQEQRRTIYRVQFLAYEKNLVKSASELLRDFILSDWLIDPESKSDPDARKEVDDLIERSNQIVSQERSAGEMDRLKTVLLQDLKVETFLAAVCEKLYPRMWVEAYGPYWVQQCGWIKEKNTYWNSLISMLWDGKDGVWVSEDGMSFLLALPPTMELIKERADEQREKPGRI